MLTPFMPETVKLNTIINHILVRFNVIYYDGYLIFETSSASVNLVNLLTSIKQ